MTRRIPGLAYPQPYEGIAGTDRADEPLLGLDPGAARTRLHVAALTRDLHEALLCAPQTPDVHGRRLRLTTPLAGDYVVEQGAALREPGEVAPATGLLLEVRHEWEQTHAEWAAQRAADPLCDDENRMIDKVWYLQYGPAAGNVVRWTNCTFWAAVQEWAAP